MHLIFQSSEAGVVLERIDSGDAAVFLGGSLFRLLRQGAMADRVASAVNTRYLCVLAGDLAMFGVEADDLVDGVEVIEYADWVELTIKHKQTLSWC